MHPNVIKYLCLKYLLSSIKCPFCFSINIMWYSLSILFVHLFSKMNVWMMGNEQRANERASRRANNSNKEWMSECALLRYPFVYICFECFLNVAFTFSNYLDFLTSNVGIGISILFLSSTFFFLSNALSCSPPIWQIVSACLAGWDACRYVTYLLVCTLFPIHISKRPIDGLLFTLFVQKMHFIHRHWMLLLMLLPGWLLLSLCVRVCVMWCVLLCCVLYAQLVFTSLLNHYAGT